MASAIYRSGFFCHHPEAQEKEARPQVLSPLTSVSQKMVGSPFRAPCPFTQTTLESALSVNRGSSSGSKYSCPWAHAPSLGGTQPKPSAVGGLDLSREPLREQLARPDAAPEGAGWESPAGLKLTLLALLLPLGPFSALGDGQGGSGLPHCFFTLPVCSFRKSILAMDLFGGDLRGAS